MTPEQIKPWVDLLTWQVIAVFGALTILPGIYMLMFRISEFDLFGVKGKLRPAEAAEIAEEAEQEVELKLKSGAGAAQTLDDAADDGADTPRERFETAMKVWSVVAHILRDLAVGAGSKEAHAAATKKHIEFLSAQKKLTQAQARRATELMLVRNRWRRKADRPISEEDFQSFVKRCRRLGNELARLSRPDASAGMQVFGLVGEPMAGKA